MKADEELYREIVQENKVAKIRAEAHEDRTKLIIVEGQSKQTKWTLGLVMTMTAIIIGLFQLELSVLGVLK